ncbi:RHS repeat-associated core domain-containing protein [Saccharomonospora viridis]|uniref:Rhs family protein n=1 Tax=Saccharomonospora viridis (strain ATCC 15386 / DSM 43017 / JCM 3036 / CCUG 5913 / NBRC 12207 / NCIMB 9602 / P101) TaxID=471857 RepID=C7MZP3_SACVD|nr:RHS repeat-associated core domain-containing protein [Saccharomonospora viridis]ACU98272.1 Rhs family protein [Saccharomonospora viridis DSM 43017]
MVPRRVQRWDGEQYQVSVETTYDAYGRITSRTDAATVVTTHSLRQDGGYNTSYTFYDGFLRERQSQLPAAGDNKEIPPDPRDDEGSAGSPRGRIVTDTWYDSRGLVWKVNDAYFNNEAPSDVLLGVGDEAVPHQTITEFDALERPTAMIFRKLGEEQWRTTNTYGGDRVHIDPPDGDTPVTVIRNAQGEMVERRQYHGDEPSGEFDATTYTYTPRGELKSVTDPAGNTWSYDYDVLGRKISSHDPDSGTTTYVYDELDQLVSTTDERGRTLAYTYDELGRRTAMFEGGPDGTKIAEWTYDTLKKGLPTASTRFVDGHAYTTKVASYDEQNRVTSEQVVIPEVEDELARTYTFRTRYFPNSDLVEAYSMPAAGGLDSEAIGYEYNELGLPTETYGWDTYAQEHLYSPYGETLRLTIGEGGQRAWVTNYFTEGTRRLDQTILDRNTETGYRVADRHYSYDPAGNITRIANAPKDGPQDVQCFAYDYLRRLTSAHTPASDDCQAEPAVTGLGGVAPYWVEFAYDESGNRLSEVWHEVEGDTTRTYEYPSAGQAQPHTLTAVTQVGPGGTSRDEFAYDAVGNTVSRTVSGDTQLLEWNAESRVERVEYADGSQSSYVYDADGNRLLTKDPKRTVLFLPGMELTLDVESGEVTAKRFYEHAGTTVAVRSSVGGLTMLFGDHQGTATESIESEPELSVSRRYFTPFGAPRGERPESWPTDHGFVGGTRDVSGLTHLGAREYDPTLGRFISVDPIMDLTDPQQMHGYAYSNNSPVTFSDPSGLLMGAACGPDGILCGRPAGMDRRDYIETRSYWMRKRGDSPAVVRSFQRLAWKSYAPHIAREQVLAERGISAAEYEEMRALANSKQSFFDYVLAQLPELAADLTGLSDVQDCFSGSLGSCVAAIIGAIPVSKLRYAGKIFDAVSDAFKWRARVKAARRGFPELEGEIRAEQAKLTSCLGGNSFAPGTLVLLADGSTKPIEEVELGDRVLATDPDTGESEPQKVVATIVGHGHKDLVEVTVDVDGEAGDATETITATAEHPFWVDDHGRLLQPAAHGPWGEGPGWYDAEDLDPGDQLRTPDGDKVRVVDVRGYTATTTVHNLTINGIHTYRVVVGGRAVLTQRQLRATEGIYIITLTQRGFLPSGYS